MITCIAGDPGGGKSLYSIWLMNELAKVGKKVATNIELRPAHPSYKKIFRIGTESHPILGEDRAFWNYFPRDKRGFSYMNYFIDEADIDLDATEWKDMAKPVRLYFKQHRKYKDNIWLITQNPNWLYNRVRDLVREFVWCDHDDYTSPGLGRALKYIIPQSMMRYRRRSFRDIKMTPSTLVRTGHFTNAEAEELYNWYYTEQIIGQSEF
ncbi:MAG: zonular occludens toxin domain-containing protein [Planctomycetota bacterium]